MTNKFLSKGTTLQSEPGPLASVDYISPDEGIDLFLASFEAKSQLAGRAIKSGQILKVKRAAKVYTVLENP